MKGIVVLIVPFLLVGGSTASPEAAKLINGLLANYVKYARPVKSEDDSLEVEFGISLLHINDFDIAQETAAAMTWLNMEWKDYQMRWNPEEYGGIESIRLPPDVLWVPDILVYNSLVPRMQRLETDVVVYADGLMSWVPPALVDFNCNKQDKAAYTCEAKVGSWTYDGSKLNMTKRDFDTSNFLSSTYSISDTSAERHVKLYECCPEPYIDIVFRFKLTLPTEGQESK